MGELSRRVSGERIVPGRWRADLPVPVGLAFLAPAAALFVLLFLVPLGRVITISLTDPHFGLDRYRAFFQNPAEVKALMRTLEVCGIVTAITVPAGAVVAWTLRTTSSRVLRLLLWSGTIFPLWMSVVVFTYVFTLLLQRHGLVNRTLQASGVTSEPMSLLYNTRAVVVAMVYVLLPLAILPLYASFARIDDELVLAAESLGASRIRALSSIVLALAFPGFLASAALVFVVGMGFYITPTVLGSATEPFLGSRIADQVGSGFDVPAAAAGGSILLLIALAIVAAVVLFLGPGRLRRMLA
jgi:ABC-type spermidine/putrescine transport system permease subunit I